MKSLNSKGFNVILYLICFRFIEEEPIHEPELLVIVGALGLLVNVIGLCLLYGKTNQKQNATKT